MKAVILAAGMGTRLYPVTQVIPKPLLPLANRPTLDYAFDRLKEIGVQHVCVVVGRNEAAMRDALGERTGNGLSVAYARQPEAKGLAHAMSFAKDFVGEDDFCMYLGDAVYSESLSAAAAAFRSSGCANLNLVKAVPDPSRFGVANVDGDRIVRLVEKPQVPESNLAMAGVYFFRRPIWDMLDDLQPSARGEYEITDAIQMLVDRGHDVRAGVYTGEWFDTGTLDSFLETSAFLIGGGTLIHPESDVAAEIGDNVVIGPGSKVRASHVENAVVLPGATVASEGAIRRSLIGGNASGAEFVSTIAMDSETRRVD
jgi:glucose-1-phosphate thymidylyltransferase